MREGVGGLEDEKGSYLETHLCCSSALRKKAASADSWTWISVWLVPSPAVLSFSLSSEPLDWRTLEEKKLTNRLSQSLPWVLDVFFCNFNLPQFQARHFSALPTGIKQHVEPYFYIYYWIKNVFVWKGEKPPWLFIRLCTKVVNIPHAYFPPVTKSQKGIFFGSRNDLTKQCYNVTNK